MKISLVRESRIELAYKRKLHMLDADDLQASILECQRIKSSEDKFSLSSAEWYDDRSIIIPDRMLLPDAPDVFEIKLLDGSEYIQYKQYLAPVYKLTAYQMYKNVKIGDTVFQVPPSTHKITLDRYGNVIAWYAEDFIAVGSYDGEAEPQTLWELK